MKKFKTLIQSVRSWVLPALCVSLAFPFDLLAQETAVIASGTHVRVFIGPEVRGEGFVISGKKPEGVLLAQDETTMTFQVDRQPVRVAKPGRTLEGTLQVLDESTLTLRDKGDVPIVVPRTAIVSLDVRQRASRRGKGAAIGALVGLGAGVLAGLASGDDTAHGCAFICFSAGDKALIFSVLTVPAGSLLGVAVAPGNQWDKKVPLDRVRVGLGPTRGRGVALSLSVGF